MLGNLQRTDSDIFTIHLKELRKQQLSLHMIPSDNIASMAVLEALSIPAQNRYSEGYPGRRY